VNTSDLYTAVHWTARLSALLFAAALAAPLLPRPLARRSQALYVGFVLANSLQFLSVTWLARMTGGANLFPGGRSLADVGGWPAMFGIFGFFYALALVGFVARQRGARASSGLRAAGTFSTTFIGFMFVATYVPLVARSRWYAIPAVLVAASVLVNIMGERLRRLRCLGDAAA
jgi:hypothetical protein